MLEIRLAQTPEERERVFKLRYQIYVEELGWVQNCANYEPNHREKKLEEALDISGEIFLAFKDRELVGSIRINYAKNLDSEYYPQLYKMREHAGDAHPLYTSIISRLMVKHHLRGSLIGLRLIQACYNQQLINGIKFDFVDCEKNMITFIQKLGYKFIETFDYQVYGSGNLMMLEVFNVKHLEKVKSPLRRVYKNFLESKE